MSGVHMTQELRGKPVISIVNGNVLAWLEDGHWFSIWGTTPERYRDSFSSGRRRK